MYNNQRDVVKRLKSSAYLNPITCEYEGCPQFNGCPQMPSAGKVYKSKKAKIFFVFDTPDKDDADGMPCTSSAGMFFRDKWLDPFLGCVGMTSYLITYIIRSPLPDSRSATEGELAFCRQHFMTDLMYHRPEVIVAIGKTSFEQLYRLAKNKEKLPDPETTTRKLRLKPFTFQFDDDYSATVYIGYHPSYILKSPASTSYFIEDRDGVVNHFCPNKKDLSKQSITIDKIDLIDTVAGTLDFIDFLTRGLPQTEMFDVSFDTETENLNRVYNNNFLSWQFAWQPGHAVFIPIDHPDRPTFRDPADKVKLISAMQRLFSSSPEKSRIAWFVAHNGKFDLSVLQGLYRILLRGSIPLWDTMLAMHWLDENRKAMAAVLDGRPYSLKTLGRELFGLEYSSEAIERRADGDLVSLSFDDLVTYGGTDAILTWHLRQRQLQLADSQPNNARPKLERFMRHYYSPASIAIAAMECNGLHVAKDQLQYLQGDGSPIWSRLERIENIEIQESPDVRDFRSQHQKLLQGDANVDYEDDLWGDDDNEDANTDTLPRFNVNKKDQETAFYLDFLNLEPLAFSKKTKKATLNKEFLNHYADREVYLSLPSVSPYLDYYKQPISHDDDDEGIVFPKNPLQLILEYRELSKLGNTYLESIGEMIGDVKGDCIDGRVRANYNLSGTDTGRLCIGYDSRIYTVNDTVNLTLPAKSSEIGIPIQDIKIGDYVYCYDDEGNLQLKKVLWQGKTGTKQVLRLHWSAANNRKKGHLDLTPEHQVRLLDGSYKMAKDLQPNDRLLSLAKGLYQEKKKFYSRLYCKSKLIKEHHFVFKTIYGNKPDTIHHKDGNPLNNHPDNLIATTCSEHTSKHLHEHWKNGVYSNNVVVRIEQLLDSVDVYDLEVEDCHNFIANEICVHNSSNNPNFQNLPSGRTPMAKAIKNLFQAERPSRRFPQGTCLIQLDYKTAEVRWAAIFAKDQNLIRLFNEARHSLLEACSPNSQMTEEQFQTTQLASDIHRRTASLMYNVKPEEVSKAQRQASKSTGFGLLFGMGVKTLALRNGWAEDEAQEKIDRFFSAFPQLHHWLENAPKTARAQGYMETLMCRRRRLGCFFETKNFRDEAKASRLAMNAPIQGQSSDGGTIGMFQFFQFILDNSLERKWLIQNVVHDSVLVQVPIPDLEKALNIMQHYFVQGMADYIEKYFGFTLPLPIECEIEVGLKYGDLTKWDGRPSTLPTLIEKLKQDAEALWYTKKEKSLRPSKDLDLAGWQGNKV